MASDSITKTPFSKLDFYANKNSNLPSCRAHGSIDEYPAGSVLVLYSLV